MATKDRKNNGDDLASEAKQVNFDLQRDVALMRSYEWSLWLYLIGPSTCFGVTQIVAHVCKP